MATDIVAGKRGKYEGELLPYDLLLDIFSYLPAKKILQLQLLSKSFRRLAADLRFRLLQSRRNVAASGVFVIAVWERQLDFHLLNRTSGFSPFMLAFLEVVVPNIAVLLASSRGLLFYRFHGDEGGFFAVNPACNEVRMIPSPPDKCCRMPYSGLAVKFVDDDDNLKSKYQLVYLRLTVAWSNAHQFCLYDSSAGEWIVGDQQVDLEQCDLDLSNLVVFEGSVFGASRFSSCVVASIDTSTRLVDFLPAPESVAPGDEMSLAVWEEAGERPWLCLVHYDRCSRKFTVWRWSKGSSILWIKFHEVAVDRRRHGKVINYFILRDGGTMNGMLLFFNGDDQAYAYSFKWRQFTQLETKTRISSRDFFAYSNTLQPC